ncbi:unnamed protein product [Effrenium voratum]|uniref:Ribosome biogenesis protein BOP1 homolog n=1 Tax=Effrenium voratum TaxID=2562239 RepID=A0AA36JAF3_9DINO|nr:unnamed protein product [Effrenium voratum]CAJ1424663.1 unnamed protein product [Effrenium voratum]
MPPRLKRTAGGGRSSSASSRVKKPRRDAGASTEALEAATEGKELKTGEELEAEDEDTEDESNGLVDDGSSDDSEDDAPRNRIGNVPLEWYKDEDHVGYDIAGEKVMRTLKTSEIDALLESKDNPDAWRTIKDHKNQREVVLTDTDLEIIRRIRQRMYPSLATDTTEMVEFDNPEARIHPEKKAHPPKARFLPSKWEAMKVKRLVALLREGKIRPPKPPPPEVWDLWADEVARKKGPPPLPAPKLALPGHAESYNPPSEYLFNEDEKKEWEDTFEEERTLTHVPQKFDALRRVPAFKDFIVERFKRCLDLYLVPRALKQRMNVDPESLLPKLPSPKDLRPFPTHIAVAYEGHSGMVRAIAVEASGRYLATASSDETLRIWEVATGRPVRCLKFSSAVTAVAWNPQHLFLAVAAEESVFFLDPGLQQLPPAEAEPEGDQENREEASNADAVPVSSILEFKETVVKPVEGEEDEEPTGAKARAVRWRRVEPDTPQHAMGCRLSIATDGDVQYLVWHHKGNYCAAVSPKAKATSNQCIIHALTQQKSMRPFARLRGGQQVQSCAFHPSKPHFMVATMRSVRIYDLQKQAQIKQLISGAKWISSITVHPSGDHVVVGSYDRRVVWWDLDFASKPYKTLQYHDKAVRCATFHPGKFPLLAACSDDATVSILHAKVFSDLMQSPMIVPVKRLRDHMVNQGFGVLSCAWHPVQPWLFTAGADGRAFLWA